MQYARTWQQTLQQDVLIHAGAMLDLQSRAQFGALQANLWQISTTFCSAMDDKHNSWANKQNLKTSAVPDKHYNPR